MPYRRPWRGSWEGRPSPSRVHAQFNGNLRRLGAASAAGSAAKSAPPMESMHPGLLTRMLEGHADPKPSRKRSPRDFGLGGKRSRRGDRGDRGDIGGDIRGNRGGDRGGGRGNAERECAGQQHAETLEHGGDEDSASDSVPLEDAPCIIDDNATPGLMTKMLQHHEAPALSVRRPAEKCLPSKHAARAHDPTLKQGLLTSMFVQHPPQPSTGLRLVVTPKPSSKARARHHANTLPQTIARNSLKAARLRPSPPPTSRVLTPNHTPRQSQFHSTLKSLGGHRMPLKYRKSIAHLSNQ
jgi:hypothetical protein